jgi:hypothetical protein
MPTAAVTRAVGNHESLKGVANVIGYEFHGSLEQVVSRAALPQGSWTIRLIAIWPVAGVRVKKVHACLGIAKN